MNALFQLQMEMDSPNMKFPIKRRFVRSLDSITIDWSFLCFIRWNYAASVLRVSLIAVQSGVLMRLSRSHKHDSYRRNYISEMSLIITSDEASLYAVHSCHGFCPQGEILMQLPRWRSSPPPTCSAPTDMGMDLHVDVSNDGNRTLSKWINISLAIGRHGFQHLGWSLGWCHSFLWSLVFVFWL